MFVQRKRSIISRFNRYRRGSSNVAFICNKTYPGFTVGRLYKPFAYSLNSECYKDFSIFDDHGRVLIMENKLVDNGIFNVVYTSKHNLEFITEDVMADIDKETEKLRMLVGE